MTDLTFLDLFSGAGLFSQGFIDAGFRPRLGIDLDGLAIESYNRNIGEYGIRAPASDLSLCRPATLLLAGPPCQGFSTLGRRDPADDRNRLCMVVPAWAEKSRARVVVVENVLPFVASPHWKAMNSALKKQGFEVQVWQLDAARYGTPQKRVRAFTVASKIGTIAPPKEHAAEIPAKVAFRRINSGDPMHIWPVPSQLALERFQLIPPLGDKRDVLRANPRACPPSWRRLGTGEATDVWGRIDRDKPANTLRCRFQNPSTGRYIHPAEDRVLSVREGARLQGVDDNWVFVGHREAMVRQGFTGFTVT